MQLVFVSVLLILSHVCAVLNSVCAQVDIRVDHGIEYENSITVTSCILFLKVFKSEIFSLHSVVL